MFSSNQKANNEIEMADFSEQSSMTKIMKKLEDGPCHITPKHLKRIVLHSACESLVVTYYAFITSLYLDEETPWYNHPLIYLTYTFANFAMRLPNLEKQPKLIQNLARCARAALFAVAKANTIGTVLHEDSHVISGLFFYGMKAKPTVTIKSSLYLSSGLTHFENKEFNSYADRIGHNNANIIIDAAGVSMTTLGDIFTLILAQACGDRHAELGIYLKAAVIYDLFQSIVYALSPYYSVCTQMIPVENTNTTIVYTNNDFCSLEEEGIPPYVAALFIMGTVLLTQLLLSAFSHCLLPSSNSMRNQVDEEAQPQSNYSLQNQVVEDAQSRSDYSLKK